jgi:hypothetical protein
MRIAIHDGDGGATCFPNLALMKIAAYHKSIGDGVDWFFALQNYDKVYSSKLFTFSKHDGYLPHDAVVGGTGVDVASKLPTEMECSQPDYSIYPGCDFSIQLFSRGCIRACPFCVASRKEGKIRPVPPMNLNPKGKHIEILDNNFFANPDWRESIAYLRKAGQKVNFHGIDVRLMDGEQAHALNSLRHEGQIHIAWDNPRENIMIQIREMVKHIKPHKIMCYVLVGYWSTEAEDLHRIGELRGIGVEPYVMAFDRTDGYQRRIQRWCNHKAIFNTVPWHYYR